MNKTDFLRALPEPLQSDPQAAALAQIAAQALDQCAKEMGAALIYSNIENLPEELLDILAYDFKIDWYDSQYTLEEKRRTIRDSWRARRFLGTKYAVETALSAIYPGAEVLEWFQYGGEPYHFRVSVKILDVEYDPVKHKRVLERIQWYKNLRSRLDRIHYDLPPIIFIERPGGMFEKNLRFKTFVNYWSCYCFDGKRRFDGSIDFSFKRGGLNFVGAYIRMKAVLRHWFFPSRLKMKSLRISNQERIPLRIGMGRIIFDNMGEFIRLNGEQQLDGSWFLWQRARSAIFQNFCIRAAAREEPSVFFLIQSKFRIIHYSPNYLKQSYYKTGVLKFAPITETIISRTQIKHSQREINQAPLLWNAVFSFFRLKNKDNIFLSQIWRMSTIEKQSFSFRRFDFLIHYLESTGSGDLRLSAGVFPITDAFEKISSKLHWRVETPKQYLILSPVRFNIQTKISRFISKIKVQKFYFSPYPFHNRNEIGNVYLTMVEPSRADGEDSFDGTLAFDGKAVPKTEMI